MAKKGRTKGNKICPAGIAWAKRTFDTYPSAYANMAASKYCKDPNYAKGSKKKQMSTKQKSTEEINAQIEIDKIHANSTAKERNHR